MSDDVQTGGRSRDPPFTVLTQLLGLQAGDMRSAPSQAAQVIVQALRADMVDAFLHLPDDGLLVALGVSDTPMGARHKALGLDRLPVDAAGTTGMVFVNGTSFRSGDLAREPREIPSVVDDLGARPAIAVSLRVGVVQPGVLQALSMQIERFSETDLRFRSR